MSYTFKMCCCFLAERDKLLVDKHEKAKIRRERIIQQKKLPAQRPRTARSRDAIDSIDSPKDWTENANIFKYQMFNIYITYFKNLK